DGPPTRANIIDGLYSHIRDNPLVQYGDSMVFYFSGHGSRYDPYEYFPSGVNSCIEPIEAICPADRGTHPQGYNMVLDISDREFNTILGEIRDIRGPNIAVILDCCHSG
ncbi:hypothetical protein OF83DRAFT_1022509, partial [Amylostereum chailletii]